MNNFICILIALVLTVACQTKKADQLIATPVPPVAESAPTAAAPTAKIEESLFSTPLGAKLKADFNPNPVSQAAIDQNIIIEYALKNNLDVQRTASGLYYIMEKEGKGTSPTANDVVSIHYRGYLLSGEEFDNSYKKGGPLNYRVSGFVPAWVEALQMMKPGSKMKLLSPSVMAYGQMGTPGGPIGPNAVLAFEMELLKVEHN